MFTSRAEYRLILRQDNADLRLSHIGHEIGLLPERNYTRFLTKEKSIQDELARLRSARSGQHTLEQLLKRPEVAYADLPSRNEALSPEAIQQVEISLKYAGYIDRQETDVAKFKAMEEKQIPCWLDYNTVPSLRREARQKLEAIKPATLGQASRISGVSPADITLLMVAMKRGPGGSVKAGQDAAMPAN
jgi:tRNA uridine 5-carboxymethylaminomethyl modification enzyme